MPGIASLIREININISEFLENKNTFTHVKPIPTFIERVNVIADGGYFVDACIISIFCTSMLI